MIYLPTKRDVSITREHYDEINSPEPRLISATCTFYVCFASFEKRTTNERDSIIKACTFTPCNPIVAEITEYSMKIAL